MAQVALGIGDHQLPAHTVSHPPPIISSIPNQDSRVDQNRPSHVGADSSTAFSSPLPRLTRAFTMPMPSQLGHLQRPRLSETSPKADITSPIPQSPSSGSDELASELADSVQMVIQTLLQISPPQLLDPAKEQLSGCALQVPTPSISALFTSMKMLNYMSRHMTSFNSLAGSESPHLPIEDEFDVGELLQSVGDALSGVAAEAGVDLVIFHTDSSLKDLRIKTDECGLIYSLSYITRQILSSASKGDVLEIGLRLSSERIPSSAQSPITSAVDEPLFCNFEFKHRTHSHPAPDEEDTTIDIISRPAPNLQTPTMSTLLRRLQAEITITSPSEASPTSTRYELRAHVQRGTNGPTIRISPEEEAVRQPFPGLNLAQEPTVTELLEFSKTLKGRKATFHASTRSSFAHYLTSYLTGWGMDVTHVPTDSGGLSTPPSTDDPLPESLIDQDAVSNTETGNTLASDPAKSLVPVIELPSGPSFTIIDDDVNVLKIKCSEFTHPLRLPLDPRSKQPSLAGIHRPKSFLARRALGTSLPPEHSSMTSVIVYFTSLSNYREVKDVVQAITSPTKDKTPEIIVIPKPAGVRRFLTALYTATTRPYVDPVFFSPIATSPMSPSGHHSTPFFAQSGPSPNSAVTPPASSSASVPDTSTTPFSSGEPTPVQSLTTSPLSTRGYFDRDGSKIAGSASSGLLVKSPDGRTGIFFQPFASHEDPNPSIHGPSLDSIVAESMASNTQALIGNHSLRHADMKNQVHDGDISRGPPFPSIVPMYPSPPIVPSSLVAGLGEGTTANPVFERGPTSLKPTKPVKASIVGARSKKQAEVVPPISVLIVEDNAIQRTILSTFMKNKHIHYGVAENGAEAVDKWENGNYHLLLMDIQMPVMDGIAATKKIREIEATRYRSLASFTPQSEAPLTPVSTASGEIRHPSTPFHSSVIIVALTAQSSTQDRVAALAAGCNDFLSKPVKLQWLERKIIEWGSIKALQKWADPDVEPSFRKQQQASAQAIAENLHIGRIGKGLLGQA